MILPKELASFPSPFLRAIQNSEYSKGESEFSVTQLLSPPQRTWLALGAERHETAYGSFMALLGTSMHNVLERNLDPSIGEIGEKRMFAEILGSNVSGQLDYYFNKCVSDYKLIGGIQTAPKPEHHMQVQMNGLLAEKNGLEVIHVSLVYIQRDWSFLRSQIDPSYPISPFKIFVHPYLPKLAEEAFHTTVRDHQMAKKGKPRDCTVDEKWQKPTTYALKKHGGKRARKLCDSYEEAMENIKKDEFIETRLGERTYCNCFCGFKDVCPQYKRESLNYNRSSEDPQ